MSHFKLVADQPQRTLVPGFEARMIHTDRMTIAYVRATAGSELPAHQHPHEQLTNILEGTLEMTVDGETVACTPGTVITIPGNAVHSARAITDCRVIDVFQPAREDYQ